MLHKLRSCMSKREGTVVQVDETFIEDAVAPGSTVITDGWSGYTNLGSCGYTHIAKSQRKARLAAKKSGTQAPDLLPDVHRIASLFKRWLMGTHQGAYHVDHLQSYLDEFVFRFNRRAAKSRGLVFYRLLEAAVRAGPYPYRDMIRNPRPGSRNPTPWETPKP